MGNQILAEENPLISSIYCANRTAWEILNLATIVVGYGAHRIISSLRLQHRIKFQVPFLPNEIMLLVSLFLYLVMLTCLLYPSEIIPIGIL